MLSRIIKALRLRFSDPNSWNYYKTILLYDYPEDVKSENGLLFLKKINLKLKIGQGLPVMKNYQYATKLIDLLGAKFRLQNDVITVSFDQFVFEVQTAEDLFILNEVYIEGCYNFLLAGHDKPVVVIDIGMNVGFASIFFASNPFVDKVYSFEPFKPTYFQAKRHLELNDLSGKVQAANYGIGGESRTLNVEYTPEFRGQVGIYGTELIKSELNETIQQEILIAGVSEEMEKIVNVNHGSTFVFKIDCEGAEYELMEKMPQHIMERTKVLMLEWHENGPDPLLQILKVHGFSCFSFSVSSKKVGMLYAVKQG